MQYARVGRDDFQHIACGILPADAAGILNSRRMSELIARADVAAPALEDLLLALADDLSRLAAESEEEPD